MVHLLQRGHLQHGRHHCFHDAAETQAGEVLQRDDPADGARRAPLPRPHHLRRHRLRVQAQQPAHGPDIRGHVGRGPDRHPRRGRLHQDPRHVIEHFITHFKVFLPPSIVFKKQQQYHH